MNILSRDADTALWLDKRRYNGEPDIEEVGDGSFITVTSSLHTFSGRHSRNIQSGVIVCFH